MKEGDTMRSIKQLLRQPLRAVAGILLTAIAVAVLGVTVSQTLSAKETARKLKDTYVTVALPSGNAVEGKNAWLDSMIGAHPDIITKDIRHVLASAYAPELVYDNHTAHRNDCDNERAQLLAHLQPASLSYGGAMLEIRVKELYISPIASDADQSTQYLLYIDAEILQVIELQEGYPDPTGFQISLSLTYPDAESIEPMAQWHIGDRLLVYGTDYTDLDWALRDQIADKMLWYRDEALPQWDLDTLEIYKSTGLPKCKIGDLYHGLTAREAAMFLRAELTVRSPMNNDDGIYHVPSIAKLSGTAEEFLASEEGALWRQTLADMQVNMHAFPVIGTDNIQYVADFSTGRAEIQAGRAFTPQEAAGGEKVCMISASVATLNGIQVGDQIDLRLYDQDLNHPDQKSISDGHGIINPTAYYYDSDAVSLSQTPEYYTVVGIYKQDAPWGNIADNLYTFSPNTIFVPTNAIDTVVDRSEEGQFRTLIIASDRLGDLQQLAIQAGMDSTLEYYDNGYHTVAATLVNFEAAATRILPLGLIVFSAVIFLFLFLFPARESRTLTRMDSLGASGIRRVTHVLVSTLGILLPGSILGTGAAIGLWGIVADEIKRWMGTSIEVSLDTRLLWVVMAVQLIAILLIAGIIGAVLSARVNYMKKR